MKKLKYLVISIALSISAMVFAAPFVGAVVSDEVDSGAEVTITNVEEESTQDVRRNNNSNANERNVQVSVGKLDSAKLRVCKNRERVIKNVMLRISDRSEKQLMVFDKIVGRVQVFYETKGYQVANYEELVANANKMRENVYTSTQGVTTNESNFDCSADDPKAVLNNYKNAESLRISAMKDYKTAINELLVTVKSAAETQAEVEVEE